MAPLPLANQMSAHSNAILNYRKPITKESHLKTSCAACWKGIALTSTSDISGDNSVTPSGSDNLSFMVPGALPPAIACDPGGVERMRPLAHAGGADLFAPNEGTEFHHL